MATILQIVEPLIGIRACVGHAVGVQDASAVCGIDRESRCAGLILTEFEFSGSVVAVFESGTIVIMYSIVSDQVCVCPVRDCECVAFTLLIFN